MNCDCLCVNCERYILSHGDGEAAARNLPREMLSLVESINISPNLPFKVPNITKQNIIVVFTLYNIILLFPLPLRRCGLEVCYNSLLMYQRSVGTIVYP